MENSNQCDYTSELTYIVQLITALEVIVGILEDNPVRYPDFILDVLCLTEGVEVEIDEDMTFTTLGLYDRINSMYDTMAMLELEVQFELEGEADEAM